MKGLELKSKSGIGRTLLSTTTKDSGGIELISLTNTRLDEDTSSLHSLVDYIIKRRLLSADGAVAFDNESTSTMPAGSEHSRQQLQQNFMANTAIHQWLARLQYSMAINLVRARAACQVTFCIGTSFELDRSPARHAIARTH